MIFISDFVLCDAKANIINCSLFKLFLFDIHSAVLIRANMRRLTNVGLMLGQRRRRWTNIKPELTQLLVFAEMWHSPRTNNYL